MIRMKKGKWSRPDFILFYYRYRPQPIISNSDAGADPRMVRFGTGPPFWQINHANSAYFRLFLGYFGVISVTRPPLLDLGPLFLHILDPALQMYGGYYTNLRVACFVCHLKTKNTFWKNNVYILKQIVNSNWNFSRPSSFSAVCTHFILIPHGSTWRSTFLVSNESSYFLIIPPKFQFQICYTLEVKAEYVLFWGTNFDFLMYFHNSLIPSVTYLFLPRERK